MTTHSDDGRPDRRRPQARLVVEPLPFALLDEPLEYIAADHARQRAVCAALRRFSDAATASRAEADLVIAFMEGDLPLHHEDEEADLFPLLRQRALAVDDLGIPLARLGDDHRKGEAMAADIVAVLARDPGEAVLRFDDRACGLMRAYSSAEQRHLALENSVVLAIARIRLTRSDLAGMSRRMKARRGSA